MYPYNNKTITNSGQQIFTVEDVTDQTFRYRVNFDLSGNPETTANLIVGAVIWKCKGYKKDGGVFDFGIVLSDNWGLGVFFWDCQKYHFYPRKDAAKAAKPL